MTTKSLFAAESPTPVVFDQTFFEHVTMGDAELQQEVLKLFSQLVDETLDSIPRVTSAEDWRHVLHRLKGAALSVGANAMAACAQRLENGNWRTSSSSVLDEIAALSESFEAAAAKFG